MKKLRIAALVNACGSAYTFGIFVWLTKISLEPQPAFFAGLVIFGAATVINLIAAGVLPTKEEPASYDHDTSSRKGSRRI